MNAPEIVFAPAAVETDKTGETDGLSNGGFPRTLFAEESAEARPVVVSFVGNPTNAASKDWFGRPWSSGDDAPVGLPADANYFSLAVFRPNQAGQYRRHKVGFHALHALMLDDVGTTVASERLTVPPSWLLETSPGNYQAGYLLREPLTDGRVADRLMDAPIAAGLCDPGTEGPRTRLARLPVTVNGKHSPPFRRRLNCAPDRRYSDEREINRRRLGWWIRRHAGRIVDGRRFVRASGNRSAEAWQVESVSPVSLVSRGPSPISVSGAADDREAYTRASRGA